MFVPEQAGPPGSSATVAWFQPEWQYMCFEISTIIFPSECGMASVTVCRWVQIACGNIYAALICCIFPSFSLTAKIIKISQCRIDLELASSVRCSFFNSSCLFWKQFLLPTPVPVYIQLTYFLKNLDCFAIWQHEGVPWPCRLRKGKPAPSSSGT